MRVRVLCYLDEIYTAFITGRWGDHCVTLRRELSSYQAQYYYSNTSPCLLDDLSTFSNQVR